MLTLTLILTTLAPSARTAADTEGTKGADTKMAPAEKKLAKEEAATKKAEAKQAEDAKK